MSEWTDRITNHPVMQDLAKAVAFLETLDAPESAVASADLARLRQALQAIQKRLASADAALLLPKPLAAIQPNLQNLLAACKAFAQSKDRQQLVNANNHLDSLLVTLASLPLAYAAADLEVVATAIESVRLKAEETHRALLGYRDEALRKAELAIRELDQLREAIKQQQQRNDAAVAQHQQQHSQAQAERQAEFAKAEALRAEAERKRADAFAQQSTDMGQRFQTQADALTTHFNEAEAKREERFTEQERRAETSARAFLDQLEALKGRAEELVRVTANTGMVGGYQAHANEERSAARLWKFVAFVSAVGLVVFAVSAFMFSTSTDFSWPMFAGRVFVATTFGLLGVYAARLANLHLIAERDHRRTELELASIGPFLVGIPDAEARQIKREFAARVFGNQHVDEKRGDLMPSTGESLDALGKFVERVSKSVR